MHLCLQASKSGPMSECINRLLDFADISVLPGLVPRLCELIRKGLGSATKSGCAHVASGSSSRISTWLCSPRSPPPEMERSSPCQRRRDAGM